MYSIDIKPNADKIFQKISKKDINQMNAILKKIEQILQNPTHFKPLRGNMHGSRRVHIDKSFVLLYEIDEVNKIVTILDYRHHDNIY